MSLTTDRVTFSVNGARCSVGNEVNSKVTLLDYIRNTLELRGTKYMCREGGCGACNVSAVTCADGTPISVNSCLVSATSCQGWEITTVEKVGNKLEGYHELQKQLAAYNGTQCGYCTPGWIMAMYSLITNKKDLTKLEIENSFGGNICRCTGYRPILDAFKNFATVSSKDDLSDIEDLTVCSQTDNVCEKVCRNVELDWCVVFKSEVEINKNIEINLKDGKKWFKVYELHDVFEILNRTSDKDYMLVFGNTAKGAYPIEEYPEILIDISSVSELKGTALDQNLVVGAGSTLTEFIDICEQSSKTEYFGYLQQFYEHLKLVAHIPVRNIGSIGGNLMIKHQHSDFPSDLFLLLETVGAQLTIINSVGVRSFCTMQDFLKLNMNKKVIYNVLLPPLSNNYRIVTNKIMPRAQNAHAIVHAGFLIKLNSKNKVLTCRIVFGGLSPKYIRASSTEKYLIGKELFVNETLQSAVKILEKDLKVTENPPEPSVMYRKQLSIALFYKALLSLCPLSKMSPRYHSGAIDLKTSRPVSQARQIFDTDRSLWPLNQPLQKIEALVQCSGEAPYTEDLPSFPHEVFGVFVLSSVAVGEIELIDTRKALNIPGVIAFYAAEDIPGLNSFNSGNFQIDSINNEEVLCSGAVKFCDQPVGIVVAESQELAIEAARTVHVQYKNVKKPVIFTNEAIKDKNRVQLFNSVEAKDRGNDVAKVIKGDNALFGQYHFTMETLVCVTRPTEEGIEVHSATQWMDGVQNIISQLLKMDINRIDVHVRRLGGAYGMKISRAAQVAAACSLVTYKLNRPCRFTLPLTHNMRAIGKRQPSVSQFEVGVNRKGVIQYLNESLYQDYGYMITEGLNILSAAVFFNCYNSTRWNYKSYTVTTDTPKNTWCRSPGTLEAIATAELMMERISYEMSTDPLQVRLVNLDQKYDELRDMIDSIKHDADYNQRREETTKFNKENRWKKRGLRFSFLRWEPLGSQVFDVNIAVFHGDGSVCITHGGTEMGQGINTKAVQICAYMLNIPVDKIQVKGNNTMIAPNSSISGGSLTSQNIGLGVKRCCKELLGRLEPIRKQTKNLSWEELVKKSYESNIDLQVHDFVNLKDVQDYDIYGVTLAEVEIDVLTGESQVLRVDLLEDVGQSVSPGIDVGQIEGAFIMGLGYWTSERLEYDVSSGKLLTDRTWNYHVPQARDIPQDLRVYFKKKSYGKDIYLGAKATGEPAICMSIAVPFAIREAMVSAREESGIPWTEWFQIDGPYTVERICLACSTKITDFRFH